MLLLSAPEETHSRARARFGCPPVGRQRVHVVFDGLERDQTMRLAGTPGLCSQLFEHVRVEHHRNDPVDVLR